MKVIDYTQGPEPVISTFVIEIGSELEKMLEDARAEWKALEDAGTPYWCNCEPAPDMFTAMDSGEAYWQDDQWDEPDFDGIHGKHGVIHIPCGGYLQEG